MGIYRACYSNIRVFFLNPACMRPHPRTPKLQAREARAPVQPAARARPQAQVPCVQKKQRKGGPPRYLAHSAHSNVLI